MKWIHNALPGDLEHLPVFIAKDDTFEQEDGTWISQICYTGKHYYCIKRSSRVVNWLMGYTDYNKHSSSEVRYSPCRASEEFFFFFNSHWSIVDSQIKGYQFLIPIYYNPMYSHTWKSIFKLWKKPNILWTRIHHTPLMLPHILEGQVWPFF